LKKIDGIVVTKFDKELAMEYQRICYEKNGVIPLNNNNFNGSPSRSD
jgi:predicted  nucleic acid-binding Zn-ribbon protein